ncbi:hypothetical protein [Flavobacterium chilense]|uniref:Uncharacterized protein n=1 Tax=Flavobacterium chilense TaxID=946677 RepID=A0A1M7DQ83_9FLAO|nr:hypothetical protein [Flavobacterium chilense]SHL81661.1 hypothetical protein SAMN05444484_102676 [Flavobacterium chilense]
MIDNITMIKRSLSEVEKKSIIKSSRLVCNSLNGLIYYDNRTTKNFTGGLFIKIDQSNKLKITGSLHKYSSYLKNGSLTNFDSFTMNEAKATFEELILNTGINPVKIEITFFEIGLNVKLPIETKAILETIHSIGKHKEKIFLIDANHKGASQITTERHRDYRVYFKVYDKVFEMMDKQHKRTPSGINIIRVETVHRRCEKVYLQNFLDFEFLQRLQNSFFNEWDNLNFYNDINAPKGTQRSKIDLIRNIIYKGKNEVLKQYKNQYENNVLSKRQFYSVRDFLENWEAVRHEFDIKNSKIVPFWVQAYDSEKQLVKTIS